ncbi:hypothetical protein [cf. Phormidesmis sp. LEGE 11477]|uniref:hypothetical protein n=1 Tax=cf. Phormidesmis sp. LEGE 11477 TaxID=1828680 RepID=UPI00187E2AA8|nr:hypothetical protein [cf. Phormidesmis sp. LEGE 11477]MBE9064256.1 hypothetical protein [cf. Phormidesmis sp. LEGE 11477]
MSNRLFTRPTSLSLLLSAIALCLLTSAFLNRQPTATTEEFTPPDSARAIAIDPATQAVILEAIENQ